jgi:hypothetical protein
MHSFTENLMNTNTGANHANELIAVLAAAVAAAQDDSGTPFRVVSFKKSSQTAPVWNLMGRQEYISGKL